MLTAIRSMLTKISLSTSLGVQSSETSILSHSNSHHTTNSDTYYNTISKDTSIGNSNSSIQQRIMNTIEQRLLMDKMMLATTTGFPSGNGDESPPCGTVRKRRGDKVKNNLSTSSGGLRSASCSTATAHTTYVQRHSATTTDPKDISRSATVLYNREQWTLLNSS
jgi:hypothetical protein